MGKQVHPANGKVPDSSGKVIFYGDSRPKRARSLSERQIQGEEVKKSAQGSKKKANVQRRRSSSIRVASPIALLNDQPDDPAKQQTNVESLLIEMFADDYSGPNGSAPGLSNSSSTSPNPDAFLDASSFYHQQEQLRQSHSSMSWNKTRPNSSPILQQKTFLSFFGEDGAPGVVKLNAPTPTTTSAWPSKDVQVAIPVSSAWGRKKTTEPITQSRQASNVLSNPNPSFAVDEIEPEPTATPVMNSKAAKGKKPLVSASDRSPVPPPSVETVTTSSKAPATTATASAIPELEPEMESVLPQREFPKLETTVAVPNPIPQASEHTSWLPKTVPAMAHAAMDSEPTTSTPRPVSKIPAHVQETLKSEGTLHPDMLKKKNLMADIFNATSSRTTLEQMPPTSVSKGPVWVPQTNPYSLSISLTKNLPNSPLPSPIMPVRPDSPSNFRHHASASAQILLSLLKDACDLFHQVPYVKVVAGLVQEIIKISDVCLTL